MKSLTPVCVTVIFVAAILAPIPKVYPQNRATADVSSLLIGKWQSARHVTQFLPDHTWFMDPEPGDTPRGTWSVRGRKLTQTFSEGRTVVSAIVSLDETELVIADIHGFHYTFRRVP